MGMTGGPAAPGVSCELYLKGRRPAGVHRQPLCVFRPNLREPGNAAPGTWRLHVTGEPCGSADHQMNLYLIFRIK